MPMNRSRVSTKITLPDCTAVEMLDCCACSLCYCPDRRSRQSPTVFSMAADMTSPRAHANLTVNHDAPVNWLPLVCLALHHNPIYGHLSLAAFAISFESSSFCLCIVYSGTRLVLHAATVPSFRPVALSSVHLDVDLHCNKFCNK